MRAGPVACPGLAGIPAPLVPVSVLVADAARRPAESLTVHPLVDCPDAWIADLERRAQSSSPLPQPLILNYDAGEVRRGRRAAEGPVEVGATEEHHVRLVAQQSSLDQASPDSEERTPQRRVSQRQRRDHLLPHPREALRRRDHARQPPASSPRQRPQRPRSARHAADRARPVAAPRPAALRRGLSVEDRMRPVEARHRVGAQRLDELARGAIHGAQFEAARLAEILLALRAGHDLAERAIGDQRGAPLSVRQAGHNLPREILGGSEQPEPLVGPVAHRGGMGADKERCHGDMASGGAPWAKTRNIRRRATSVSSVRARLSGQKLTEAKYQP